MGFKKILFFVSVLSMCATAPGNAIAQDEIINEDEFVRSLEYIDLLLLWYHERDFSDYIDEFYGDPAKRFIEQYEEVMEFNEAVNDAADPRSGREGIPMLGGAYSVSK